LIIFYGFAGAVFEYIESCLDNRFRTYIGFATQAIWPFATGLGYFY